jgi:hypothetical protein
MIYKDIQIFIDGQQVIQINKRKAKKLYNAGYEILLHPCKMAFEGHWQRPSSISMDIYPTHENQFEQWVDSFEYYNCNSDMGRYPRYFVQARYLDEFNTRNQ